MTLHVAHLPMPRAWGLAADAQRLAVATHREITVYANSPRLAASYPGQPNYFDAYFTPRVTFFTGECLIHDMAIVANGLLVSNTRFSNVSLIDGSASFNPVWHPHFITACTPDDRCHLNGITVEDGRLRYVTTFGPYDQPQGWRARNLDSGVIVDAERDQILCDNLCLPHSPRLFEGTLFAAEAGTGTILRVDRASGQTTVVATLPGFVRGITIVDGILFAGLSVTRDTRGASTLPIVKSGIQLQAGVAAVDIKRGTVLGLLRFNDCREIFDVVNIPWATRVGIANADEAGSYYAVDSHVGGYWMRFDGTRVETTDEQANV